MKNKQYKIEKGLMLFTQPRSPYFYGKIRHGNKYLTKSFAPISDFEEAKSRLYEWKNDLAGKTEASLTSPSIPNDRSAYIDHKKLENDFQFLDVGRYDPAKKPADEIGRAHV